MKRYLLLVIIVFCGCIVNGQTKNKDYDTHVINYMRYVDSMVKYVLINGQCARVRWIYYAALAEKEYKIIYPNGRPYDKIKKDTVCYPMKE